MTVLTYGERWEGEGFQVVESMEHLSLVIGGTVGSVLKGKKRFVCFLMGVLYPALLHAEVEGFGCVNV